MTFVSYRPLPSAVIVHTINRCKVVFFLTDPYFYISILYRSIFLQIYIFTNPYFYRSIFRDPCNELLIIRRIRYTACNFYGMQYTYRTLYSTTNHIFKKRTAIKLLIVCYHCVVFQHGHVRNLISSVRNSLGFSQCGQCPAPAISMTEEFGNRRLIPGTSDGLHYEHKEINKKLFQKGYKKFQC